MFRSLKRALFSGEVLPTLEDEENESDNVGSPSLSHGASSSSKASPKSLVCIQTQTDISKSPPDDVTALKEELSSLQKAVTETLACCQCGQLPRSLPVSSCSKHHHLCDRCSVANLCPSCSSPLHTTTSPLLTSLLSSIRRPCFWAETGCTFSSPILPQLEAHERLCSYQPVSCWGCHKTTPFNAFEQHSPNLLCFSFRRIHYGPLVEQTMLLCSDQNGDVDWKPLAVKYSGKMFYLRICRRKKSSSWMFYMVAQLLPAGCRKFVTRISVLPPAGEGEDRCRGATGPPCSLLMRDKEVEMQGDCLIITEKSMQGIMAPCSMEQGSTFRVRLEIELKERE